MLGLELGVGGRGVLNEVEPGIILIGEFKPWCVFNDTNPDSLLKWFITQYCCGSIKSRKFFNLVSMRWALGLASASLSQLSVIASTTVS